MKRIVSPQRQKHFEMFEGCLIIGTSDKMYDCLQVYFLEKPCREIYNEKGETYWDNYIPIDAPLPEGAKERNIPNIVKVFVEDHGHFKDLDAVREWLKRINIKIVEEVLLWGNIPT